jgi:hypothetical protein
MMKSIRHLWIICLALAGCASVQESKPLGSEVSSKGVVLVRALPAPLPSGAVAIPGSQFIIINADSAALELADMLNPIPFVTDLAKDGLHRHAAEGYRARYQHLDPFVIAAQRLAGSALLSQRADALPLKPFVYMVEGSDGRWRLSLTFRVDGSGWLGRFMYHLPSTYTGSEIKEAGALTQQTLRRELEAGSDLLRELMERDARGDLKGDGTRAEFGSYYVVGSNLMGMVPARLMHFPDAEVLESGDDHVILRSRGDLHADAGGGALAFGVHYFRKDQLHDFKLTHGPR